MGGHISQTANLALCKSTIACIKEYKSFKQIIKWITYITQLMILYLIMRCCYQLLNIAGGYLWATTDVFVCFIIPVIGFVQLYKISFSVSNDPICSISESWHRNAKMNQICKHLSWCYILWVHSQTRGAWKLQYKRLKIWKSSLNSMYQNNSKGILLISIY